MPSPAGSHGQPKLLLEVRLRQQLLELGKVQPVVSISVKLSHRVERNLLCTRKVKLSGKLLQLLQPEFYVAHRSISPN